MNGLINFSIHSEKRKDNLQNLKILTEVITQIRYDLQMKKDILKLDPGHSKIVHEQYVWIFRTREEPTSPSTSLHWKNSALCQRKSSPQCGRIGDFAGEKDVDAFAVHPFGKI